MRFRSQVSTLKTELQASDLHWAGHGIRHRDLLPFTTLIYVFSYIPGYGLTWWGWFFVILGIFLDMGAYGGSAAANRTRMPGYSSM